MPTKKLHVVLEGAQGCMHYDRSRYVKVINKKGASITTKMAIKQLRYILITSRLK
jgi:hypothetical protein